MKKRKGLATRPENRNPQPGAQEREVEKSQVLDPPLVARSMSKKERGGKHPLLSLNCLSHYIVALSCSTNLVEHNDLHKC
jgi:hypothetical protein